MKTSLKFLMLITVTALFIWACSSKDNIEEMMMDDDVSISDDVDPTDDDPTGSDEFELVDVAITIPEGSNLNLANTKVVSLGQLVSVENNTASDIPFNSGSIELAYLLDSNDNVLLAGFVSDETKEISIETTAGVLVYFGMASSLRGTAYKNFFVQNIGQQETFQQFVATLENLIVQNSKVIEEGGYMSELNNTISALSEKEVIDIEYKIDLGTIQSSGLALNEVSDKSFNVTNSYPRRTHAYLYKKSFKNLLGEETVINSEIEGNDTADRELDIPFISLADENDENFQGQVTNFTLCSQGARYVGKTSEALNLELPEGRSSETFELSVIGPGKGTAAEREMTNKEQEKFEELSVQTFVLDYFIPILMDIGGNRDVYSAKILQSATSLTASVEPILRAHEPSITAVLDNDYETAIKEFIPFLYDDIRLSNDLRNIMTSLYSIISDGNSSNTFIQNNELIQEGEQRYLKISSSILRSLNESVGISCINQRLGSSAKLEKWDVTISEGIVKLTPEKMITIPFTDAKEINALAFFDLQSGDEFEYEWSTTTQFGGVLYDLDNDINGSSFTTSNSKVSFISNASSAQLGENQNLETVTVKVFVINGNTRDEIGEATMTVDVKKQKFVIRPDNITISGDEEVKLVLFHNDGTTTIPNDETDYEVVWTTTGDYGLIRGYNITETNFNERDTKYVAFDTEIPQGSDKITAKIYGKPKNSSESFKLLDEAEATIKIENDENKFTFQVDIAVYNSQPALDGDWWGYGAGTYWGFDPTTKEDKIPEGKEVERYHMDIIERIPSLIPDCANNSKTWYPENAAEDLADSNQYFIVCGTGSAGGHRDTWESNQAAIQAGYAELLARMKATKGYAQVTVYLRDKQ
ncbi:hypothetical protein [Flagellimonas eckloniae]|uniref:Uncharacterized protein n=1 Tax=Flagellimonas eckloniae TaxID=346185 RepID=A0A0Q1CH39_9FLAO|nr:hypothetical protein [Allomuricauda eckloniae]KQC30246.1 hypothetical protein AAY42_10440 [Allomuricauda eckloniae]